MMKYDHWMGKSGGVIDDGTDTGSTSGRNLIGNQECRPSQVHS